MGGQQPMALSGQQGGQPYYNFSMMQSPEDDPWNMMQGAGSQLGAGQVSGGIGPAASSYPSLGGTPPGAWGPSQYDPNIVEAGPGQVVTKPGGGPPSPTDPVGGGPIFNKPAEMPEIPDYGPPPDIPPGPSFGGDMTLPGGETVPGGSPTR